ncbi:hypothetical protein [Roseomonas sp. USHLN139]|uniref:hypothetical protein n=1 Tax=Roseomonas sp. USHLN139 TaxID=3081298 RepID=UPI003B0184A2
MRDRKTMLLRGASVLLWTLTLAALFLSATVSPHGRLHAMLPAEGPLAALQPQHLLLGLSAASLLGCLLVGRALRRQAGERRGGRRG